VTASPEAPAHTPLLEVADLRKHFPQYTQTLIKRKSAPVKAVDGVSFSLEAGETLGLVGESGCGKSTAGRSVLRLIEPTSGVIKVDGNDITKANSGQLRRLRRDLQMVFQDPIGSLNPRHPVGSIIGAPFSIQGVKPPRGVKAEVQGLMERVGLNPEHYNRYPHEFSGGQRQRIGIARALAARPKIIVADEPVSALDVSIQAQVMNLLENLRKELGIAFVFIAHDLGVVRHFCDRVAVMYLGRVVEEGPRDQLYETPEHPYTQALLSAVPDIAVVRGVPPKQRIRLVGDVPSPVDPPSGCRFRTRCWKAQEICASQEPPLEEKDIPGLRTACHFAAPPAESIVAEVAS
jgi:oligopeptide/dipeptide ABC transporter ATP-binding protein